MIVAIDGPAGAGKSTVARALAERLGMGYLDTGAMYRALAVVAEREGVAPFDAEGLARLVERHAIRLEPVAGGLRVMVDGDDVTGLIRTPSVTAVVSEVSSHREVRAGIVADQRAILDTGDWVVDGRDIGTVVRPDAEVKVFLTASSGERARRRHGDLVAAGESGSLDDVRADIERRDHVDATRAESPLQRAEDAVEIDTTDMAFDEVVEAIADLAARVRGPA